MTAPKILLALLLAAFVACADGTNRAALDALPEAAGTVPNIVFVVADDLAKRDMRAAGRFVNPRTADAGVAFSRAYVANPVCCPSQASILRGQYAHNHGVLNHNIENGGDAYEPFAPLEGDTLATRLDGAGYETARFGKYLVDWPGDYVPPGWDEFQVWERNTENLYNGGLYRLSNGTTKETHDPKDGVVPDALMSKRAAGWVAENPGTPKFLYLGAHAPHDEHAYPPRYADDFAGASYRAKCERDLSDKPRWVRRFAQDSCFGGGEEYRERLRSMLVLRDALARIEDTFRSIGELENTYVFFTSDNGYRLGEHRLPFGKRTPYLEDVEVPLHVRGPGVAPGTTNGELVSLADLAPTALSLAGASPMPYADGRDLSPLLRGETPPWRESLLVEGYDEGFLNARHLVPTYKTAVTRGRTYTRYATGEAELYDIESDPKQFENLAGKRPGEEAALAARLDALKGCAAEACRAAEGGS